MFALATVVSVERPVSATPGDRAIVTSDGRVTGWVGGSCSEPIVVRESLAAIADGRPRLVRIRPPGAPAEPPRLGVVTEITTCASEGGVDVFVEPRRPRPLLVVAGTSPVARRLATLAPQVGYRALGVFDSVHERLPGVDNRATTGDLAEMRLGSDDAVVVATMNRYDEHALEAALATGAAYVGLVASRGRWEKMRPVLASMGVEEEALGRVHAPAGLDLGPSSQDEIALAILAEVVRAHHSAQHEVGGELCPPESATRIVPDPVCSMEVVATSDAPSLEVGGETFYFCSPGCRAAFESDPERYAGPRG